MLNWLRRTAICSECGVCFAFPRKEKDASLAGLCLAHREPRRRLLARIKAVTDWASTHLEQVEAQMAMEREEWLKKRFGGTMLGQQALNSPASAQASAGSGLFNRALGVEDCAGLQQGKPL